MITTVTVIVIVNLVKSLLTDEIKLSLEYSRVRKSHSSLVVFTYLTISIFLLSPRKLIGVCKTPNTA